MALAPKFPLTPMTMGLRAAGLAVFLPVVGLLFSANLYADEAAQALQREFEDSQHLDWVPIENLTEAQKRTVPNSCCKGAYVPPTRTDTDATLLPESAPFRSHADEEISERQTLMQLKGNVSITQGNRSISTESVSYDKETGQAQLSGGIQLRDPKVMIRADSGDMNLETGDASFNNTRFVLYENRIHGVAATLKKFGDNVINLEQSLISSCEPGDNAWSVRGSEISLHPDEHYGTAKNMRINIQDIPVFYLPYIRFPVGSERLTGFLIPTPSYSKRNGTELAVPFYWNIAPNADATFTSHYLSSRGFMLETQARHLSSYFKTELNSSVINNDKGGFSSFLEDQIAQGKLTEQEAYPYRDHDRWYAKLDQVGGIGQKWSTRIDYADLSDKDYLRDMYNGSTDSNRQAFIRQTASADYRSEHWFSGVKVDEYRLLTTSQLPYRELPRIHVNGNYQVNDWVLKLNNEYVNFVENRYLSGSFDTPEAYQAALLNTIYGDRVNTDYSLTWDKTYPWGFVKPSVALKSLTYQLDSNNLVEGVDASQRFVVPQISLDTGLYFERNVGDNYLQTLEPRAFYFYSDYQNQDSLYKLTANQTNFVNFDTGDLTFNYNQLFRTTRFAGGDRLDDANQISLAVSTAFLSQDTGVERLRMSIGQIFYAKDREVMIYDRSQITDRSILEENTRATSDWAVQASGQINKNLHASADATYDQRTGRLNSANSGVHYMDKSFRIFNLTYRYALSPVISSPLQPVPVRTEAINQLDTSIVLPITSRWSIIARNSHDFTHGVELDTYAGLEYNDCCYRVRVMGRRWLRVDYTTADFFANLKSDDFEPGIMIELELKGLGSMDKQIGNLLEKTITGFAEREKTLR
jgi:LPS-assembly protein